MHRVLTNAWNIALSAKTDISTGAQTKESKIEVFFFKNVREVYVGYSNDEKREEECVLSTGAILPPPWRAFKFFMIRSFDSLFRSRYLNQHEISFDCLRWPRAI